MIAVRIPKNWTPQEADAAITLIQTILEALWRQYPEAHEEHFPSDFDYHDSYDPPLNDCNQSSDDEETGNHFSSDQIPF